MKRKVQKKSYHTRNIVLIAIAVLLAVLLVWWWHTDHSSKTQTNNTTQATAKKSQVQPITSQQPAPQSVVTTPAPNPDPNVPSGSTNSTSGTLEAPSGTFVSNHSPSLSDMSRNQEVSDCTTTPGATCEITFTQGGTVKTLGQKTASTGGKDGGTISWSWTPQSVGLTTGTWKVTATATMNGQTKSTQDATNLSVQP